MQKEISNLKDELKIQLDKQDTFKQVADHYKFVNKKIDKLDLEHITEQAKMNMQDYMSHEISKDQTIKDLQSGKNNLEKNNSNLKNIINSF